jgi:hypothetical protein
MSSELSAYNQLIEKLDEFIRKYYKNQLLRGLIYCLTLFFGFYLVVSIAEYFGNFSTTIRTTLFYSFLAFNALVVVRFIVIPLLKLYKLGKTLSYEQAAEIVGKHFSNVNDKLLNVLQLNQQRQSAPNPQYLQLLEASISQKTLELRPVPFVAAIDLSENKKFLAYLGPVLVLFLGIYFIWPTILTESTNRLVHHDVYFEPKAPFSFQVSNSSLQCVRHEDFTLDIKIDGSAIPNEAYVEVGDARYKLEKENQTTFHHTFRSVQKNTKFRLFADGFYSKEMEIVALPNPILLDFEIKLDYPAYTGKLDEVVANSGDITVPFGTKAYWTFRTKDTRSIKLSFNDTTYAIAPTQEGSFHWNGNLRQNKTYSITAYNEYFKSKDSVKYYIAVVPDLFPTLAMEEQKDSTSAKRLFFTGQVGDDYGFKKLVFNYSLLGKKDSSGKPIETMKSVNVPISTSAKQDEFFHVWDLHGIDVQPGDQLEYYFEVFDNDGVNGSKSTRSEKRIFKIPSLNELAERSEKKGDEIKQDLQSSINLAKQIQKQMADLNKKMMEKKSLSWEDRKQMRELMEMQKELEQKVEEVKKENASKNQEQSEFREMDPELLEKQQEIQKLFDQVMTEEMKKMMEEMQKLMDQMDKEKAKDMLDKMKLTNEDISKELDRTLELFKKLELEQKMNQAIEKMDDLAKRQEELSKQSENKESNEKELKEEQDKLNKEFEELKKEMDELEKQSEELGEKMPMEQLEQDKKEVEEEMKKSSEELGDLKKKQAAKSQKKASEGMQSMSKKMKSMMDSMAQEAAEEDLKALREILENLLKLSFDQESLIGLTKNTSINDPNYTKIARQQQKLRDDSQVIQDSLFALSKRITQIQSTVNKEINAINDNMGKSITSLADRNVGQAQTRQQYAMTSINNLALLLSEIEQQMAQSQSQSSGNGSCKKPGKGQPKPSAANMRAMQEQLSKQLQKMKEGMEKGGKKPGDKKGMGQGGVSKELAKMAAQQEAIRQMMGDMMKKQAGKDGKIDKGQQGNLGRMAELMEQNETDMVNRNITNETLKRQQEILTRLLEAEKSERERGEEEKRESKEAKNQEYSNPALFFEYKHKKQQEDELLKTIPLGMQPFYKEKVNTYFNSIE